jgi:hypothetical protein
LEFKKRVFHKLGKGEERERDTQIEEEKVK